MQTDIDIVLIWVDDTDIEWQKAKSLYEGNNSKFNVNNVRYRDWDTLRFWFRGVEMYAPWVRKIHFVTCGHVPSWLNLKHPKLHFVKHSDYIPERFLPTFSSHPIELNIHRIPDLSDKFIYFNDDVFLISPVQPSDFFIKNLPCDCAILNPQIADRYGIGSIVSNDLGIIADHYNFKEQFRKNINKWINYKYGLLLLRTFLLLPWGRYLGFYEPHVALAYLKSTFKDVWEKEPELLEQVCSNKFRSDSDVNQWLMRYWQLASGNFIPRKPGIGKMYSAVDIDQIESIFAENRYKMICINDSESIVDIASNKNRLHHLFDKKFPDKSSFEL